MRYALKALDVLETKILDGSQGIVEAYCSVFNNVDYAGEVIRPGFFKHDIEEAATTSKKLPTILWSHNSYEPPLGRTTEAEEVLPWDVRLPKSIQALGGLRVVGSFNMDYQKARDIFTLIQRGDLDKYSIGYYVIEDKFNRETGLVELLLGKWVEWSPVNFAANDMTLTVGAKGAKQADTDEHTFIVRKPEEFVEGSFKREERTADTDDRTYMVVTGKSLTTGDMEIASIRFKSDAWSVQDAQSLCNGHGRGTFVPANDTNTNTKDLDVGTSTEGAERLADHGARVVAQLSAYVKRVEDVREKRLLEGKAGRELSEANRTLLASLLPDLDNVSGKVRDLLERTAPTDDGKAERLASNRKLALSILAASNAALMEEIAS